MSYHITAFVLGFVLDLLIGDPMNWPHPVRWIGSLISAFTNFFLNKADKSLDTEAIPKMKQRYGIYLVLIIIFIPSVITILILRTFYTINPFLGCILEAVITYQCIAAKSLCTESMKVYHALKNGTLEDGRKAVSMIVGRDTAQLDETGVVKAAVETVAENTSDGVIAPLIYLAIGGPVLGIIYKSINTMDSMVGYKNDKYMDFGKAAAKLDDVVNFIPARVSAWLMIISCAFLGKNYNGTRARKIYLRDRFNHASPNSAQTESACAGALGVRLAGPASYFGKRVEKPYIGDDIRPISLEDIKRANVLMYATTIICMVILIVMLLVL